MAYDRNSSIADAIKSYYRLPRTHRVHWSKARKDEVVRAVLRALDPDVRIEWRVQDGDRVAAGTVLATLAGRARALVTAERASLNFLQTLSGTATVTAAYVEAVRGTGCTILDTRKTLPGLRLAQKYAVRCGGGQNHRIGLYDAVMLKENHVRAALQRLAWARNGR